MPPTAAPKAPAVDEHGLTSADHIVLDMLGDDLKQEILAARKRMGDASITCRIGEIPGGGGDSPPGFIPGLVSIHREGKPDTYGLSAAKALAALAKLKA